MQVSVSLQLPEEVSVDLFGQQELLVTVKRRNLAWFGHVTRHDSLSKTILHGTVEGRRRLGLQRKCWLDNIKEGTSLPVPGPLAEKTGRGSLLNRPWCPRDEPIRPGTELY